MPARRRLEFLGAGLARLALVLEGLEGGNVEAHATGGEALRDEIQFGTEQLNIKHDNPYSNLKPVNRWRFRQRLCACPDGLHRNTAKPLAPLAEVMKIRKLIAQNF